MDPQGGWSGRSRMSEGRVEGLMEDLVGSLGFTVSEMKGTGGVLSREGLWSDLLCRLSLCLLAENGPKA